MIELLVLFLASAIVAAGLATALVHWRPAWSARRTIIVAAAPLPGVIAGLCIWLFLNALTTSAEECGVDACGMVMAFSVLGIGYAVVGYAIGAASAAWVKRSAGRS